MSEVKRLEMDHKGLPFVDDNGVYVLYEDYTELKAQRDALAAENAELKELYRQSVKELDDTCFEIGMMRGEKSMEYPAPETPATDAWLNSVRATAFDDLYAAFVNHSERAGLSEDASVTLRECNDAVLHCCDKLRAGKEGE